MPAAAEFQYVLLRVVPALQRGERINAGVVVYCPQLDFLEARVSLDGARLAALPGDLDAAAVAERLEAIRRLAAGEGADAVARLPAQQRFGWLAAPASTAIQPSPIHTGLTTDPRATLNHLFATLVA